MWLTLGMMNSINIYIRLKIPSTHNTTFMPWIINYICWTKSESKKLITSQTSWPLAIQVSWISAGANPHKSSVIAWHCEQVSLPFPPFTATARQPKRIIFNKKIYILELNFNSNYKWNIRNCSIGLSYIFDSDICFSYSFIIMFFFRYLTVVLWRTLSFYR